MAGKAGSNKINASKNDNDARLVCFHESITLVAVSHICPSLSMGFPLYYRLHLMIACKANLYKCEIETSTFIVLKAA